MKDYPIEAKREIRKLKNALKDITLSVSSFLAWMDLIMRERESVERGKSIARVCNELDLDNQRAKHFGLDIPLDKLQNKLLKGG